MQLSEESLRAFMAIYEEEFQEKITMEEAREMGTRVITYLQVVGRLIHKAQTEHAAGKMTDA